MGSLQNAANNWPEDEAYETLCWMYERELEDDPVSQDELKQIEPRLFNGQPDKEQLLIRYRARIRNGLSAEDKQSIAKRWE